MKDTTKKKIKRVAKISAIVIGAILATLGAVCSAALLTKCGSAAEQKSPIVLAQRPKGATADGSNGDNLVEGMDSYPVAVYTWSDSEIVFGYVPSSPTLLSATLEKGSYIFRNPTGQWAYLWTCWSSNANTHMRTAFELAEEEEDGSARYTIQELSGYVNRYQGYVDFVFDVVNDGTVLYINADWDVMPKLEVYNLYYLPPLFSVDFTAKFFPFQGIGSAGGNPVILSDLTYDGTSGYPVRRFDLDGLYFVSGKRLWSGISILYESAYRQSFFTADGQYFSVLDTHAWYITGIQYYYGPKDSPLYYEKVWDMTRDYQRQSGEATQMYYGAGAWVANMYRYINVVYIKNAETAQTAPNGLSFTPEAWIDVLLTPYEGNVTIEVLVPDGGNVFSLFTNAFGAILPLFDSQILPGISFGMLIFLPIIAGIIVIIVKVVKK